MKEGKPVILCVDDDADFLDSMRTIIESNDYIMDTAPSAEQGLRKFKEEKPDLVLVDLMMEEIDSGTNLVKETKLVDKQTPVIMLSSVGDDLTRNVDYSEMGMDGVLQKPVDPEHLLSTIEAKLR
ncbi:MAG: response regulator transcription factor [Verrucomicrobiota bacterium]